MMPLLNLPFIIIERKRLRVTLHLIVSTDMKWRVLGEALVVVIHVLEVLLMNSVIHYVSPCIWIMIFPLHIL
jgi:hypothetical protein